MACGDSLRHLVVTSTGLSPTNPYDDVPSFTDYEEWLALAQGLTATAETHFEALAALVGANPQAFLAWNELRPRRNDLLQKIDDLSSSWFNFSPAQNISEAMAASIEATCFLELVDARIVEHGGTPPVIPGAPPARKPDGVFSGSLSDLKTIAVIGAVVVGAAFIVPRLRRR